MSTYHPKTLKRWKVHKRSLQDLRQPSQKPDKTNMTKSQVIHSFDADGPNIGPPYPLKIEKYRLEDSRNKFMQLSNGFRKVPREHSRLSFSKVVSQQRFIRVDFSQNSQNRKTTIINSLPRMVPKSKKIMIRNQLRRPPPSNSFLKDLLEVKAPSILQAGEILATDEQLGNLHLLQDDSFSPYRVRRPIKSEEQPPLLTRPIHQKQSIVIQRVNRKQKRKEELTSESIGNFISIGQMEIRRKQAKKLQKNKLRSFSVIQIKCPSKLMSKCVLTRYNRRINTQIQPWQTDK